MDERGKKSVDQHFSGRSFTQRFLTEPSWKVRSVEIVGGAILAYTQDVTGACIGVLIFMKGMAGPEAIAIFRPRRPRT